MRRSGILMHITSLPGPEGIGTLGQEAYDFADFLHSAGMTIWQMLPVGPVGYGESPYQSTSVYAGNPLLISIRTLEKEGLVTLSAEDAYPDDNPETVCYEAVRPWKEKLLRRCYQESCFKLRDEVEAFADSNPWVRDYALFTALKEHFGGSMWTRWPDEAIRRRKKQAVAQYEHQLKEEISYQLFVQYLFFRQWFALKKYANDRGILMFGDMPIYVAEDSADTWTQPDVFQLDRNGVPKSVAGVPPDFFSEDGQKWGNPLYRWWWLRLRGYDWWVSRMKGMAAMFDMVRIDHFIGFANYCTIPYGDPNARRGRWVPGPGKALFRKLNKAVPGLDIVAEDLGEITNRVKDLMAYTGYPGMKVMCYGFGGNHQENCHYPGNYKENDVLYTGTHDNDTVLGWYSTASEEEKQAAREALSFEEAAQAPEAFVRAVMAAKCRTAVVPMQDVLGLDGSARMNYPGTIGGNWRWRMLPGKADAALAERLLTLNKETNRERT
ncbi:MAG: 4-alpha-glucanotransferase [Clostridia bacterium]|nr:4-alpha-glucanotransferase [Clostridia bacterium]